MSRIHRLASCSAAIRARVSFMSAAVSAFALSATAIAPLSAQAALGTPFIGQSSLSFYTSELTRAGGPDMTTMYGVVYGRRFGETNRPVQLSMVLRGAARAFDDVNSGVLDVSAELGVTRHVQAVKGLSVSASSGVATMAWSDDVAKTGRLHVTIPANAGMSYDLHVKRAVIAPFVKASVGRYNLRTALNDVQQTNDRGWDASYATGASLRLKEVVLTSSRIIGEHAMPNRSRWTFSAGLSF